MLDQNSGISFEPVSYDDVPGWFSDPVGEALILLVAAGLIADHDGETAARNPHDYLQTRFVPHRVVHCEPTGLLTGYYEPILKGSRTRSDAYPVPLYRQPDDLVKVHDDASRGHRNGELVAGRMVDGQLEAYFTRGEIEGGALDGRGLEFVFLADPIDAYFLHIQGSGRVQFEDGSEMPVGFAAKNGLPYTSIGRVLIDAGAIPEAEMSLDRLRHWLEENPERMANVMHRNESFIFFQEHADAGVPGLGPVGSLGVSLTAGRSLAVDTSFHALGTPIFVTSDAIKHHGENGFHRLMVAQDVGSAIRGPERGDIFWGTGDEAGKLAGETVHQGNFFVLLPRVPACGDEA